MDFAENTNSQEYDVDAIIANAYGQSSPTDNSPVAEQSQPSPEPPQSKEFEFNARGQMIKIKEDDPRLSQWLSQGYDYSQNINGFKQEREGWEKSRQDWEQQWGTYREIDNFAKQNPDWWNQMQQSYEQKLSTPIEIPDQVKQYLEPIIKDYGLVKSFVQDHQKQQIEKANAEQDAKLGDAIKSIQEKYPNLDFVAKDESGLSLEHRVLKHAGENGFPTFRSAFLDYYHDSIEKQAEARGKEQVMSEMKKRQKLGLLDNPPAPGKNPFSSNNQRPKSWNDPQLSADSILKEFKFS